MDAEISGPSPARDDPSATASTSRPHAQLRCNLEKGLDRMQSQLQALLERSFQLRFHALRLRQRVSTAKLLVPNPDAPDELRRNSD